MSNHKKEPGAIITSLRKIRTELSNEIDWNACSFANDELRKAVGRIDLAILHLKGTAKNRAVELANEPVGTVEVRSNSKKVDNDRPRVFWTCKICQSENFDDWEECGYCETPRPS